MSGEISTFLVSDSTMLLSAFVRSAVGLDEFSHLKLPRLIGLGVDITNIEVPTHPVILLILERVLLAQRVSVPIRRQENAAQIGVMFEPYAEEILDLPLEPVGGPPKRARALDRFMIREGALNAQPRAPRE